MLLQRSWPPLLQDACRRGVIWGWKSPRRVSPKQCKQGFQLKNVSALPEPGRTRSVHTNEPQGAAAEPVLEKVGRAAGNGCCSAGSRWGQSRGGQPRAEHRLRPTPSSSSPGQRRVGPRVRLSTTPQRPSLQRGHINPPPRAGRDRGCPRQPRSRVWLPQVKVGSTGSSDAL